MGGEAGIGILKGFDRSSIDYRGLTKSYSTLQKLAAWRRYLDIRDRGFRATTPTGLHLTR